MPNNIEHKIDRLHDKVDALRNDWAADRVIIASRLSKVETDQTHMAGKLKIYLTVIGAAFALGANMLWDWVKVKFMGVGH